MEWEKFLKDHIEEADATGAEDRLYHKAFVEGCRKERALAIEAHRLRCSFLFGNRCMNHSRSKLQPQSVCAGNCFYIRQYEFELHKLED